MHRSRFSLFNKPTSQSVPQSPKKIQHVNLGSQTPNPTSATNKHYTSLSTTNSPRINSNDNYTISSESNSNHTTIVNNDSKDCNHDPEIKPSLENVTTDQKTRNQLPHNDMLSRNSRYEDEDEYHSVDESIDTSSVHWDEKEPIEPVVNVNDKTENQKIHTIEPNTSCDKSNRTFDDFEENGSPCNENEHPINPTSTQKDIDESISTDPIHDNLSNHMLHDDILPKTNTDQTQNINVDNQDSNRSSENNECVDDSKSDMSSRTFNEHESGSGSESENESDSKSVDNPSYSRTPIPLKYEPDIHKQIHNNTIYELYHKQTQDNATNNQDHTFPVAHQNTSTLQQTILLENNVSSTVNDITPIHAHHDDPTSQSNHAFTQFDQKTSLNEHILSTTTLSSSQDCLTCSNSALTVSSPKNFSTPANPNAKRLHHIEEFMSYISQCINEVQVKINKDKVDGLLHGVTKSSTLNNHGSTEDCLSKNNNVDFSIQKFKNAFDINHLIVEYREKKNELTHHISNLNHLHENQHITSKHVDEDTFILNTSLQNNVNDDSNQHAWFECTNDFLKSFDNNIEMYTLISHYMKYIDEMELQIETCLELYNIMIKNQKIYEQKEINQLATIYQETLDKYENIIKQCEDIKNYCEKWHDYCKELIEKFKLRSDQIQAHQDKINRLPPKFAKTLNENQDQIYIMLKDMCHTFKEFKFHTGEHPM